MDCKEGDGQREGQAMGSSSPRSCGVTTDVDGMPATVNILKPQIDLIFSEVQKNLPTIDFDSSDISSDNDEPIFFHQQLKMGELSGAFDDDKDLDTSLSGGDSPLVGRSVEGTVSSSRVNGIKNNSEDENELKADDEGDDMYDNDLAAFLEKSSFPSDDEIVEWRRMSDKMEEYQRAEERHELDDLRRSQLLGHLTNIRQSLTASSTGTSTSTDGHFGQHNRSSVSTSTQACEVPVDPTQVTIETDEQEVGQQDDAPPTVKLFNQRLQDDMANVDPKERRRLLAQQNRSKDSEIASKFAPREPTMLSLRFFEEVDLDSVLHAASEENIPISSLRLVGRPTANQIPQSHSGGGDTNGKDAAEELTLIQKLAHLSMTHSGTDLNKVKAVDPRTGAVIEQTDPRLISNQSQDDAAPRQPQNTEGPEPGDFSTQTPGTSISSAGTNTATAGGPSKILFGRLKHEKRDKEPPTVFIDLRGFEKQKQEEHQGLESVQRVLGIQPGQQGEEESSSEEEEEMVERCDWRLTRQKIKQDLTTQGAAATLRPSSRTVGGGDGRQVYKKPPRVINLQEHSVSKKWARRPESSSADPGEEGEESEERRMREEEDNKARMEKLEAEREKERQREEARKQREKREKERERRVRMSQQVEAARSQASTQGRQAAGENTQAVFDLESSYEPAPTTLPTTLPPQRETLLLSVHLSSNGEIVQHRNRSNRSVDTGEGLSATYTALLSWLLSLVPGHFGFLGDEGKVAHGSTAGSGPQGWGFHVLGLQQLWFEEQLKLVVVVTPSLDFATAARITRSSKGKRDEVKGSSRFAQHMTKLLSTNTLFSVCPWLASLVSVEVKGERPEDKNAPPYAYSPPLPKISTKPLSTFVQVNPDPQAARKIFNIPVGFLWQTVDNEETCCDLECHDDGVSYETQNTMSLVYKKIFQDPVSLMAILNRVSQEGLDLSGVRLLYPSPDLLKSQNADIPQCSALDMLNNVGPVLALSLRGTFARTIWLDAIGPSDPELARRTDPNSLCAQFGGESREKALLFCPRNPSRVQTELTRWFGGRVPPGAMSMDLGLPYIRKEEGRGKKGKKGGVTSDLPDPRVTSPRPPAALTATGKGDIILVLSPLLPLSYIGVVMATGQRRGYQIRGVKRVLMTGKIASTLGIAGGLQPFFCPGARLEEMAEERPLEASAPCTVLILRKENATHSTPSLIEAFMVQLTLAGLLGCVQMRCPDRLTSKHLFHAATYSDVLLAMLGGQLHKSPEFDLSHLRLSSSMGVSVNNDLEQMAVVIILGHDLLKKCGMIVGKILNVLPFSKTSVQPSLSERFELLGLKWTPALTSYQAKELTPFEVGDRRWRQSVRQLTLEPALVLALRGVDIFRQLKPLVDQQQSQQGPSARGFQSRSASSTTTSTTASKEQKLECIMSLNPGQSDAFSRLFFYSHELFPDPLARSSLPFLPECRLYFNIVEREVDGVKKRLFTLKPLDDLDLTQESIMAEMAGGQQPISTLLLVKPSAVSKFLSRILRKVVQEKFSIVGLRLMVLGEDMAEMFVPPLRKMENTLKQRHLEALTSAPSLALVLSQKNAVKKLCDLIGPEEPMAARRMSQFLWRGEFGTDLVNNGLYCSVTYVDAMRDVRAVFPDGLCCEENPLLMAEEIGAPADDSIIDGGNRDVILTCQPHVPTSPHDVTVEDVHSLLVQTTCLVFPPPLLRLHSRGKELPALEMLANLLHNGFELQGARLVWLTQRQAQGFLSVLGGGSFRQVTFLCEGPCLVLALQRDNAVVAFNTLLDSTSESIRLMREYGELVMRPSHVTQAHALLAYFFDQLMPGSQVTIRDSSCPEVR